MLGSPLASPSVDTNSSSPFKDAPPTDRPYKDLTDRQTRYQKAVCVVNAPGKFAVTGTLLMCRGQCCVLFGAQANALVPRDAGQADFDGGRATRYKFDRATQVRPQSMLESRRSATGRSFAE